MSEKSWSLSYIVRSYINLQSWSLAAKGYRLVIICKVTIDKEQGQRGLYIYYIIITNENLEIIGRKDALPAAFLCSLAALSMAYGSVLAIRKGLTTPP